MRRVLLALAAVALCWSAPGARAFEPGDPLVPRQWYLVPDRPFDLWPVPPTLAPVRVAVIDSGIDLGHPEFAGRIAAARSFVAGSVQDTNGHGTFVAGEIAAALGNGQGIAGIAFPAQLVVAKVLRAGGTIDPETEARAIRWALGRHARVINLSFGGLRDPAAPALDEYSAAEQAAIDDAVRAGALVVAAVGNGDGAPREPWRYASYPAALPHVLGVGAYARAGSVPDFSNRDPVSNDLSAPGTEMLSTLPRSLTAMEPGCADQGYSDCGPLEFRTAAGTSFAAPPASAAAALLFAVRPDLRPEQAAAILERSAVDASPGNGCARCKTGRDALTGWGKLDVTAALGALSGILPAADVLEPNDGSGSRAATLPGRRADLTPTLDFWDDPLDVYRVRLHEGQWLYAAVGGLRGAAVSLWKEGRRLRPPGGRVLFRAPAPGWYELDVRLHSPGAGAYRLQVQKS